MAKTTKPRTTTTRTARTSKTGEAKLPKMPRELTIAIQAAQDRKATELTVLDLRKTGAFTDYFLICTGGNPRQVHAIADAVEQALKAVKARPTHVEGYERAEWILVDYFDFIVHVFSPAARSFYGLERLWGNATRIDIPDDEPARA